MRILLSPPDVDEREAEAAAGAVRSNWVAPLGPEVDAFESDFAAKIGAAAAAAVSSGTAGLHLAAHAAGLDQDSWVIAPTLTFVASLNALAYTGARLHLVDSEAQSGNLDVERTLDLIERSAKRGDPPAALLLVDLYGALSDVKALVDRCRELGVFVIEDAAEALGSTRDGQAAGTFGDFGVFSFNGNKIITTSGGGMCVGTIEDMERARWLASQARLPFRHFEHDTLGYNYRMSNILAAIGRVQLRKLDEFVARRREIRSYYNDSLAPLGFEILPDFQGEIRNSWLTVARVPKNPNLKPSDICDHLDRSNIEARPGWKPMHQQPLYQSLETEGGEVATELFDSTICLPSGSVMTDSDLERVVSTLAECMQRSSWG